MPVLAELECSWNRVATGSFLLVWLPNIPFYLFGSSIKQFLILTEQECCFRLPELFQEFASHSCGAVGSSPSLLFIYGECVLERKGAKVVSVCTYS